MMVAAPCLRLSYHHAFSGLGVGVGIGRVSTGSRSASDQATSHVIKALLGRSGKHTPFWDKGTLRLLGASLVPRPVRSGRGGGIQRQSFLEIAGSSPGAGAGAAMAAQLARKPSAMEPPPVKVPKVKLALCQLRVTADKEVNINHAYERIKQAAELGAQMILLPEIWNCPYSNDSFPIHAEDIEGGPSVSPSTAMLAYAAKSFGIVIIGGSIPEISDGKLYNTCCVYGSDGARLGKHRKLHLFDINIPGKISFKESDSLTPGDNLTVVDTEFGRIGVGICYDIRFPELAMLYATRGVHLICYPGAFNMTTGPLHWELVQRARAADNQVFVATCSPARDPLGGYVAWGHSTAVGPFGEVLATTEHEEDTVFVEMDFSEIQLRRQNMAYNQQRRGDIYQLVDVKRLV